MTEKHALIIDDNIDNVNVLAQLLALEGLACTRLQNATQFDSVLRQLKQVDIIFLDLEMPGISGYQIFAHLKSDARWGGVPIVGYSVHVSEINTLRQLGFHSFLGKPLNADNFPEQLACILRGERVWAIGTGY